MKILQMMGPSRPNGGGWALETVAGAATRPARILGIAASLLLIAASLLLTFSVLCVFSLC